MEFSSEEGRIVCANTDPHRIVKMNKEFAELFGVILPIESGSGSGRMFGGKVVISLEMFGETDVLVNNASVAERIVPGDESRGSVDLSVGVRETVIKKNFTGAHLCTRAVLPSILSAFGNNSYTVFPAWVETRRLWNLLSVRRVETPSQGLL